MARTDPVGGGPKGKEGFPIGDKKHARLAIGGATRSYNAGNISKGKENEIKSKARAKLHITGSEIRAYGPDTHGDFNSHGLMHEHGVDHGC